MKLKEYRESKMKCKLDEIGKLKMQEDEEEREKKLKVRANKT
jgi:hypothetical protein